MKLRALSVLLLLLAFAPALGAEGRRVAVIVDTSGSMKSSDPPRYTLLVSQIVGDLMDASDDLAVLQLGDERISGTESCDARSNPRLAVHLEPSDRERFKEELDRLIEYEGGTFFAAPIRTATEFLQREPDAPRLLLIVADSEGLGNCSRALTPELMELAESGAILAAINLGSTAGAFDRHPAFALTRPALDARALTESVASVYQRFLGVKSIQTGDVEGEIEVEIAPYVENAFLVVTADGPIPSLEVDPSAPGASDVDTDFRGGGTAEGLDRVVRSYRMVRMVDPKPGKWTFRAPGLSVRGGWMLLQDSAITARLVSASTVPAGIPAIVEVELVDRRTGRRIRDLEASGEVVMTLEVDDRTAPLDDSGRGADRARGDGLYAGSIRMTEAGTYPGTVRVESPLLDRRVDLELEVKDASWNLQLQTPREHRVDDPLGLKVRVEPIGDADLLDPPQAIEALLGTSSVELRDGGVPPDDVAGDRLYTGSWTPRQMGEIEVEYRPIGGSRSLPAAGRLEIVGYLELGDVPPIDPGVLEPKTEWSGELDLGSARIRGEWPVELAADPFPDRVALEIRTEQGWQVLGPEPIRLLLAESGPLRFPVRVRAGRCPESADHPLSLTLRDPKEEGAAAVRQIPVTLEVVEEPWWICWWPLLLLIFGTILAGILIHGYVSPSRFPPQLGVVLSPEEDIETEGFFHPIRSVRGSGSGFYRDARIYVTADYRLSARPEGALVRLRADRGRVRIRSEGAMIWRQNLDGEWEILPSEEITARYGVAFKNDDESLFFTLRNS